MLNTMETSTQECKAHSCTLAKILPVGIFQTNVTGHYLSVNEFWCEMAGITVAEAQGDGWLQVVYPDDRERVFAEWYRAVQENLPFQSEYRLQRRDGKMIWVLAQAVAEEDHTGSVTGYIGLITDISDRKRMEEALRQQSLKERLMTASLGRIRQSLNLEEILNTTVTEVRQFLQTDRVLIYRLWPNGTGSAVTEA
jgi:two-component system sensor histidine kinase/response regulator